MLPLAALLAALLSARLPAHRPLALVLFAEALLDRGGAHLSPRGQLATLLLCPVVQAWGVCRVLGRRTALLVLLALFLVVVAWCFFAPVGAWWSSAWPATLAACCAAEVHAAGSFRGSRRRAGPSQRAARLLVAVDVAALVLGAVVGWDRLGEWGTVGAAGVAASQALALLRGEADRS